MFPISMARQLAALLLCAGLAGLAVAAVPLQHKEAAMQCAGRRISVEADCFAESSRMLCTRQAIRFFGADGKALGAREFHSSPLEGEAYPVVEEGFGELSCVQTEDKQQFLVALMDNGGNCDQCEWIDVYSVDGVLLGNTRNQQKGSAVVKRAIAAAYDAWLKHVLARTSLGQFYRDDGAHASGIKAAAGAPFVCPFTAPGKVDYAMSVVVFKELSRTFHAALGPQGKDFGDPKVAASRIDPEKMAALAEASGCAALLDEQASCATYFDTELGNPLSVLTSMKKTAPLRRQYEEALAHLARPDFRRAAQFCMKLVGRR